MSIEQAWENYDAREHAPHERYYHRAEGDWLGHLAFELRQPGRLLFSGLSPLNLMRVLFLHWAVHLLGRLGLRTRVRFLSPEKVQHELWLKFGGIPCYYSCKVLCLSADGQSLEIRGYELFWPSKRQLSLGHHRGEILPCGTRARYQMPWLGRPYLMKSTLGEQDFTFVLNTGWGQVSGQMTRQKS